MCDKHHSVPATYKSRKGGRLEDGQAHSADHEQWTRRAFLRTLGLGAAATPFMLGATPINAIGASAMLAPLANVNTDRILVLVQLEGGNDGLNTIVPITNDIYHQSRPSLRIPASDTIRLTDDHGLNQNLASWEGLFNDNRLAIIQGVGYDAPNHSHFRSTDIWISGTESTRVVSSGWAGRMLEQVNPDFLDNPPADPLAVQLGGSSFMFRGDDLNMGMSISSPEIFDRLAENGTLYALDGAPMTRAGDEMRFMRQTVNDSFRYASAIQTASQNSSNAVEYTGGELGENLANVARLIKGGLNTCVYMVTLSGFDTHSNQDYPHGALLRELDASLQDFYQDLASAGMQDRVLTMTFSEFGRTIWENGSLGTDHSTAAPMFLVGPGLRGGILGDALDLVNTDGNGDPVFSIDFRSVYATVLQGWFGLSGGDIRSIFGTNFDALPLFENPLSTSTDRPGMVTDFTLEGNYPNPFQGATRIAFQLPTSTHVQLAIYDTLGRRVNTVVDRALAPGRHEVLFDGSHLPAGTYYYRMRAGRTEKTGSMVLL